MSIAQTGSKVDITRRKGVAPGRSSGCSVNGFAWAVATDLKKHATVKEQVAESLQRIDAILSDLGTSRQNIISATLYLTKVDHRDEMDAVWRKWVGQDPQDWPQRSCLITGLSPKTLFEICIVAALPEDTNDG